MKGSKYDTDKDGTCDAKECKTSSRSQTTARSTRRCPVDQRARRRSASRSRRGRSRARTRRSRRRSKNVPFSSGPAGARTTPTPTRSSVRCSTAATIIPSGNTTTRSSGITSGDREGARGEGQRQRRAERRQGPRQVRRSSSAARARRLLREARPEADDAGRAVGPVLLVVRQTASSSKNVTKYEFDQFAATPAYAHVAVK